MMFYSSNAIIVFNNIRLRVCCRQSTFDMAYEIGAELNITNVQNLMPLTLAAKLARIQMFFHILKIEREIYWQIGKTNYNRLHGPQHPRITLHGYIYIYLSIKRIYTYILYTRVVK